MYALETIINTAAILAGGLGGALFGWFLSDSAQDTLTKVCGVSTLFIAVSGALEGMLTVENGAIVSGGAMLIIGCLAIGAVIGELLNIEGMFEGFGQWLKVKTGNAKDKGFVNAFVTASLTVCIGAMAIVGSIQCLLNKLSVTTCSHTEGVQFRKSALFNRFSEFRQKSMRSFSCMANHAGKAGARILEQML